MNDSIISWLYVAVQQVLCVLNGAVRAESTLEFHQPRCVLPIWDLRPRDLAVTHTIEGMQSGRSLFATCSVIASIEVRAAVSSTSHDHANVK
jgi:hypothetical protein